MNDAHLLQLLINLADSIRDVPDSQEQRTIAKRCIALIQHLESLGLITGSSWNLGSRR